MNDSSGKNEADDLCDQWLDADSLPIDGQQVRATTAEDRVRRHVADQQLIDALLHSVAADHRQENSARVRTVMEAVLAESRAPVSNHRTTRVLSLTGIAACLLVAGTFLVMKSANESRATEILAEIRQVSRADTDRIYYVFHSDSERDAPFEFLGKLYLRGTTGFVLQVNDFAFGRHDNEYWVVPSHGAVILAQDFNWLNSPSTRDMLELELLKDLSVTSHRAPLMQLSTIVESITGEYDVAAHRGTFDGARRLDELSALRRSADEQLPASIRLWFDSETKIVYTVELMWSVVGGKPLRHSLRFTLAPGEPVADDWYQHTAHHAADRAVQHWNTETTGVDQREQKEP